MTTLIRQISPVSWPNVVKLSVFGVLVSLPLIALFLFMRSERIALSLNDAQRYTAETAQEHRAAVAGVLQSAEFALASFNNNPTTYTQTVNVLQLLPEDPLRDTYNRLLQTELVGVRGSAFRTVTLLDASGIVIATSAANADGIVGRDVSDGLIFRMAQAVGQVDGTQTMVATTDPFSNRPILEVAQVIYNVRGNVLGYLVGTLSLENTVYPTFAAERSDFLPVNSYLLAANSELFAPPAYAEQAVLSSTSVSTNSVLANTVTQDVYTGANGPVYRYFGTVTDLSGSLTLIVVTELEMQAALLATGEIGVTTFVPLLIGVLLVIIFGALGAERLFNPPLRQIETAAKAAIGGDYEAPLPVERRDEFGKTALAVRDLRTHFNTTARELENRVAARVRDLEATQEISRFAARQRDAQQLMDEVVNLIIERFPAIYHAQVFLIDNEGRYAVLRSSTGAVGKELLERGHRLAVGSVSVVGQATAEGQVIIARNTESSALHRRNVLLPETRAELAIPLRVGDRLIGALDVQSKSAGSFNEDEINVLQTMADQVAVAIENARLYQEAVRNLEAIRQAQADGTRRAWEEFVRQQHLQALTSFAGNPTETDLTPLRQQAVHEGRVIIGEMTPHETVPIAVPLRLRGQTLGAVAWEIRAVDFNEGKALLAEELVARLSVSLDIARLFQQSQLAAERERVINEINTRLTSQTDIDEILQTAVREVGQALHAPNVTIQLKQRVRRNGKSS